MIDFNLPESAKNQFKFNELTALADVKPYVLRFWESEFDQISPSVDSMGQKIYSSNDLEAIKSIKSLLFEEKLNIQEAKHVMAKSEITLPAESSSNYTNVTSQLSSLEMMKKALENDLKQEKSEPVRAVKSFNDYDVLQLAHAKRKLQKLSGHIDQIISSHNW